MVSDEIKEFEEIWDWFFKAIKKTCNAIPDDTPHIPASDAKQLIGDLVKEISSPDAAKSVADSLREEMGHEEAQSITGFLKREMELFIKTVEKDQPGQGQTDNTISVRLQQAQTIKDTITTIVRWGWLKRMLEILNEVLKLILAAIAGSTMSS